MPLIRRVSCCQAAKSRWDPVVRGIFFPKRGTLWFDALALLLSPATSASQTCKFGHHLVGVYFLSNLTSSVWASTPCLVQPPRHDADEMSLGGALYLATEILLWCVTFFLSTCNAPRAVIYPRKRFSSREAGADSKISPDVPSTSAHFSLDARWQFGTWGKEKARHRPRFFCQDRQAVLGVPLADLSSHQRVSKSQNIFQRSHLRLTAPSRSPNFLAESATPGMLGAGRVKDEGKARKET